MNNISLFVFLVLFSTTIWADKDTREVIYLDQASRAFLKHEMQGNVAAIQQALAALAEEDMFAVAEAFRPMGMQGMSHVPPSLRNSMPMGFKKLGMPLHQAFDQLANKAEMGATIKEVLADLSKAMKLCVACHSAYQIKDKQ
ncbi:MAG: hypothetical protein QM479_12225 [Pseudomonadota bacterium]